MTEQMDLSRKILQRCKHDRYFRAHVEGYLAGRLSLSELYELLNFPVMDEVLEADRVRWHVKHRTPQYYARQKTIKEMEARAEVSS